MKPLTHKQRHLLEYLFSGVRTFRDMRDFLMVSSNQTVSDYLEALVKKGYVAKKGDKYVPIVKKVVHRKDLKLDNLPNAYAYIEETGYLSSNEKKESEKQ